MRILITGSNGQFAKSLQRVLINEELICLSHDKMDISKIDVVNDLVESLKPDVIINTAALRRPGECEKNPELAQKVRNEILRLERLLAEKRDEVKIRKTDCWSQSSRKK